MNNKKYLSVGVAVLLSGVLLIATALTGSAASNAYDQFKMLLREDHAQFTNMTVAMNMSISDNGKAVLNVVGDVKADKDAKNMSGQFQISGKGDEKTFEVYRSDDAVLLHFAGSENWYQPASLKEYSDDEIENYGRFGKEPMKDNEKLRDMLMDTLMGDLKDQVILDESNGLRTFSLTLDQGNMPVLIQTVFSAGSEMHGGTKTMDVLAIANLPVELQEVITDMMVYHDLVDISGERTLKEIKVSLTVDQNNQPVAMALSTSFSGLAKDGSAHDYAVNFEMNLSDLNTTVPDEADVNPSSIITIDSTQFENCGFSNRMHH